MSNCTGCGISNSGSILRPNLACPPDLSTLMFRFVDRKSVGIVQGPSELFLLNMSKFFLPISSYSSQKICLDNSGMKLVDGGGLKSFGERREIAEFDVLGEPGLVLTGDTIFTFTVFDENNQQIGDTLSGAAEDFTNLVDNLQIEILDDVAIRSKIEFYGVFSPGIFSIRAKDKGKTYTYELVISLTFNITALYSQTHLRYPSGAYKLILLNNVFCTSCIESNKQFIQYAYNYDVIENGEAGATWRPMGPLGIFSGAEDVLESDVNMLEPIWIRNTDDCAVDIDILLAI